MKYTLTIDELIKRPILTDKYPHEFLNKMSDEEVRIWEMEIKQILIENNVEEKLKIKLVSIMVMNVIPYDSSPTAGRQ
jgi:hypothetical protein